MSPTSDASPPSKVATIVTTQPFSLGSFRTALAWEASGSACRTVLASALTVTVAAATSRPLTTVRVAAARARGKKLGRQPGQRPKLDRLARKVLALVAQGLSYRLVGREVGLSKNIVATIVRRERSASSIQARLGT